MPPPKDVDGTNPVNQGRLAFGSGTEFVPATPAAVMLLLERSPHRDLRGVRACTVGRSNVVGLPVDAVRIGMPVQPVFDAVTPQVTLIKWRPIAPDGVPDLR